jgi:6-phosphogluconolactonase
MMSNEYSDVHALENALLSRIALLIENCIHDTGKATILLSGGSTPVELYRKMSHLDLDWTRVYVGLVDERYVETHDTMSNERLIRETLLQHRAKDANFMGMVHTFQSPEDNLIQVNQAYEQHLEHVDICLLGMGNDGHTASLFPNDSASSHSLNSKSNDPLVIYTNAPAHPVHRISASFSYLMQSKHLILMLTGAVKKTLFFETNRDMLPIDYFKEKLEVHYES